MVEIEIKARLDGDIEFYKVLYEEILGIKSSAFKKEDSYYRKDDFTFRIRQTKGQTYLTFKEKSFRKRGEVNQEWETQIMNYEVMSSFLEQLKIEPFYKKVKEGYAFPLPSLLIELCKVETLGLFVELEIVLRESVSEEKIKEAQGKLKKFLKSLQIDEQQIEVKSYQELLGY